MTRKLKEKIMGRVLEKEENLNSKGFTKHIRDLGGIHSVKVVIKNVLVGEEYKNHKFNFVPSEYFSTKREFSRELGDFEKYSINHQVYASFINKTKKHYFDVSLKEEFREGLDPWMNISYVLGSSKNSNKKKPGLSLDSIF